MSIQYPRLCFASNRLGKVWAHFSVPMHFARSLLLFIPSIGYLDAFIPKLAISWDVTKKNLVK